MKIPSGIRIYGDTEYRNKVCPKESSEQVTFISRIRSSYPNSYGIIAFHAKNEGLITGGQFSAISKNRAMGLAIGCSDIIIPGSPTFVCEIKRRDHTLSRISEEQVEYLLACQMAGAFACIALGCDAATEAFNVWRLKNGRG